MGAAFPGILLTGLVFAGFLTVAAVLMVLRLLRHDPVDLLRGI